MVDLLSVGRMTAAGWELRFKENPSRCELYHSNEHLGDVPMKYNLCQLSIKFLRPIQPVKPSTVGTQFVAFTPSKRTWDLWHARLGHLGRDLAKIVPSITTSIKLDTSPSQSCCESCIVAKHPHRPFPLSLTPPASRFLELVHTNICGPFPTATLHGKHYFIVFLDNCMHLLNVQLLATRDQALDAWRIVQA